MLSNLLYCGIAFGGGKNSLFRLRLFAIRQK